MNFTKLFFTAGIIILPTKLFAYTLQTPLDLIEWDFKGDRFLCQMDTPLKFDGYARISAESGKLPALSLDTFQRPISVDSAWLSLNEQVWRLDNQSHKWLYGSSSGESGLYFDDARAIKALLNKMEKGAWAQVSVKDKDSGEVKSWDIPSVNFSQSLQKMKLCMAQLMPINFEQARDNAFNFSINATELTPADKERLALIAQYVAYDKSLTHILIDGHTDSSGHSLTNLKLSKMRANQVRDALIELGVDRTLVEVRGHGDRYPLVPNNHYANREKNRRVQVRLIQGGA